MLSIHKAIKFLLNRTPDWLNEIRIQDDGQGPFLAAWNAPEVRPDEWLLQAVAAVYAEQPTGQRLVYHIVEDDVTIQVPVLDPETGLQETQQVPIYEEDGVTQKVDPETNEPVFETVGVTEAAIAKVPRFVFDRWVPCGWLDEAGNYFDEQPADRLSKPVPTRPEPANEHYLDGAETQDADGLYGTWVHDPGLSKRSIGKIPTEVFINTVFAPPTRMENPPADYTWNRENKVRMLSPAASVRMPKYGFLSGTRAEIAALAGWMLAYGFVLNTYPPEFVHLTPSEAGYEGGIISQEEYARAIALLDEYGVQ